MKVRLAIVSGAVAFLLCLTPAARADSFTFGLLPPSGAVAGPPGATVGWGYSITNQSATNWLVLTGLSADVFLNGTPNAALFDFPTIAPTTTITVPYDPINFLGLYEFTWDPSAPVGFTNLGSFILSGEFWTNDPLAGGSFVSLAADQSAAYSATVTPSAAVPEPSTLLLLATGLSGLAARKRKPRL
jgi:hypothetical protein